MSTRNLFDLGDQYAEMLGRGIQLSGEDQFYFVEGRLRDLVTRLPTGFSPRRILDLDVASVLPASTYLSCFLKRKF